MIDCGRFSTHLFWKSKEMCFLPDLLAITIFFSKRRCNPIIQSSWFWLRITEWILSRIKDVKYQLSYTFGSVDRYKSEHFALMKHIQTFFANSLFTSLSVIFQIITTIQELSELKCICIRFLQFVLIPKGFKRVHGRCMYILTFDLIWPLTRPTSALFHFRRGAKWPCVLQLFLPCY